MKPNQITDILRLCTPPIPQSNPARTKTQRRNPKGRCTHYQCQAFLSSHLSVIDLTVLFARASTFIAALLVFRPVYRYRFRGRDRRRRLHFPPTGPRRDAFEFTEYPHVSSTSYTTQSPWEERVWSRETRLGTVTSSTPSSAIDSESKDRTIDVKKHRRHRHLSPLPSLSLLNDHRHYFPSLLTPGSPSTIGFTITIRVGSDRMEKYRYS